MKLSTLCYEEILGFEPSNITANISTLHLIIKILETSNENPEHSILKLKESNLHHYLLDTVIFFIIIKYSMSNHWLCCQNWSLTLRYWKFWQMHLLPLIPGQLHMHPHNMQLLCQHWTLGLDEGFVCGGFWGRRLGKAGNMLQLGENEPNWTEMYQISWAFAPKRKILFLLNLLSYIINIAAKPNHAKHVPLFWTHFEDQTEDGMVYSNSAETKTFLSKESKVSIL